MIKHARRVIILVIGVTVILFGLIAGLLPFVPGIVIVPLGLAILATEFVWARRLLKRLKQAAGDLSDRVTGRTSLSTKTDNSVPASQAPFEQGVGSGSRSQPDQSRNTNP